MFCGELNGKEIQKKRGYMYTYSQYTLLYSRNTILGTSLVAQWLRIRLPRQGTRVRALVREDPTCHRATKPVRHNYWACSLEPASHNYWACVPQLLKPARLEPVLRNKRSHLNEKSMHRNKEQPPLATTRESLRAATDPMQPKINKFILKKRLKKKKKHNIVTQLYSNKN